MVAEKNNAHNVGWKYGSANAVINPRVPTSIGTRNPTRSVNRPMYTDKNAGSTEYMENSTPAITGACAQLDGKQRDQHFAAAKARVIEQLDQKDQVEMHEPRAWESAIHYTT